MDIIDENALYWMNVDIYLDFEWMYGLSVTLVFVVCNLLATYSA